MLPQKGIHACTILWPFQALNGFHGVTQIHLAENNGRAWAWMGCEHEPGWDVIRAVGLLTWIENFTSTEEEA